MTDDGDRPRAPAPPDREIEQVLLGLADGSYVLSTPEGAIAECGVGVEGLLGARAELVLGRPTAQVLVAGADDAAVAAFERLLRGDDPGRPSPAAFRTVTAGGAARSLSFVVVAVPLALGWEFTSLLGELGSRDAATWDPEALRLRHGRALEAIEGVVRDGRQPDPNARLAGILVVVRDVDAPELTRADVERRMAEHRAAARAAVADEARRRDRAAGRAGPTPDPAAAGEHPGLEDLVEGARVLRERLEEAEGDAAAAKAEREDALDRLARAEAEVAAARAEADAARADAEGARADAEGARAEAQAVRAGHTEEASAQIQAARGETEAARRESELAQTEAEAARAELASERADAEALRAELASERAGAETLRGELQAARAAHTESAAAELAELRAEAGAARAELEARTGELRERDAELEARRAELEERDAELQARTAELRAGAEDLATQRSELARAHAVADELRGELAETVAALAGARAELATVHTELDATLAAADGARAEREQSRARAHELLREAERARAAADAIRAEFAFEDDPPETGAPAQPARAPWTAPASPPPAARPDLPAVAPGQAAALIALDGSFARLDDAFCSLLGCREEDLRAARWPSIIDRENLAAHQEIARALRAGEIESAEIETVYMHAQGLLVPLAGTISMHRADPAAGAPTHFLFRADVSRTAGVPGLI